MLDGLVVGDAREEVDESLLTVESELVRPLRMRRAWRLSRSFGSASLASGLRLPFRQADRGARMELTNSGDAARA